MQVGDAVRVEGDWYGQIVDIGCRRVRVRRGSGDEEDVALEDVELLLMAIGAPRPIRIYRSRS